MLSQKKIKYGSLVFFLLINLLIWQKVISYELKEDLTVTFLDVGQGDAILIEAKNGNQVLIDGGKNDRVLKELSKNMSFFDRSINMVIATHPDSDHIGGLPSVLKRYSVGLYLESGVESNTLTYESLERTLQIEKLKRIIARRGMIVDLGNEIYLRVLFPDRDVSDVEPNTASVVLQVVYGDTEFMLTGDSPNSIEKYLVSIDKESLESEVLKVGHHGSLTSSSEIFLGFVDPKFSIISAGEGNSYGHPHQEIVQRLGNFNTEIIETSKRGSITFTSDGKTVSLK
jgi:competence protein ComEC